MSEVEFNEIEPKIIKTVDENGEVHNFELIDIVNIDEQEYGLLVYLSEDKTVEADDEEEEVLIMRLSKEDDAYTFETIEDDAEFNMVLEYLENEEDDDEEEEEDAKE